MQQVNEDPEIGTPRKKGLYPEKDSHATTQQAFSQMDL